MADDAQLGGPNGKRIDKQRRRFRLTVKRTALAIAITIVAIPLLTGALVSVYPSAMKFHPLLQPLMSLKNDEALYFAFVTRIADILEVDPDRLFRLKRDVRCSLRMQCSKIVTPPIPVCSDADGYRISCAASPPGQGTGSAPWEILVVGDSNVFGWCLPHDETWSHKLGQRLTERTNRPVRVANAGVVGYTSAQALVVLKDALARQPDRYRAVVFWTGRNDANRAYQAMTESWMRKFGTVEGRKVIARGNSRLYRFWNLNRLLVGGIVGLVLPDLDDDSVLVPQDDYERIIDETARLLRDRKIHAVFLSYETDSGFAVPASAIETGAVLVRPFHDLPRMAPPGGDPNDDQWFHFEGDIHLNQDGADALAGILADRIAPWVEESRPEASAGPESREQADHPAAQQPRS